MRAAAGELGRTPLRAEEMEAMTEAHNVLRGKVLRAADVAEAALFLASDQAGFISGHNLVVDGGVTTSRNVIGL